MPIGSMYGIFTCAWLTCIVIAGRYAIHESYGDIGGFCLNDLNVYFSCISGVTLDVGLVVAGGGPFSSGGTVLKNSDLGMRCMLIVTMAGVQPCYDGPCSNNGDHGNTRFLHF